MPTRVALLISAAALCATGALAGPNEDACAAAQGERAIAACSEVIGISEGPEVAWALFNRARAYFNAKLYASAILDLTDVLRLKPNDTQALENRALAYQAISDYGRAIDDFDTLVDLQPQVATWVRERCWARAATGRHLDDAMDDCNKALALNPRDAAAHDARCFVEYRSGAYAAAIADCTAALASNAKLASSLYVRGLAKRKTNDASADADFASAKSLAPEIADTYADLGVRP
jgi:tetratricopeptide (TPR) repeat protein